MSWLMFVPGDPSASGKTKTWLVKPNLGKAIGEIRWFAGWRKYSFQPYGSTIFEESCLRDIAAFLEQQTREHKAKPAALAKQATPEKG